MQPTKVISTPLLAVFIGTGALAGCEGGGFADEPTEYETTADAVSPQIIRLAYTEADLVSGNHVDTFNFAETRDIWVRLKISQMALVVFSDARFIGPDGATFRTEHNVFSPDPAVTEVDPGNGLPPIPVRTVFRVPGSQNLWALDFPVSVGGTDFLRLPQAGTWELDISLSDRGATPDRTFDVEVPQ